MVLGFILFFDIIKIKSNPLSRQVMDRMEKNKFGVKDIKREAYGIFDKFVNSLNKVEKKAELKLARANLDFTPREYVVMFALGMMGGFVVGFVMFPLSMVFEGILFFVNNAVVQDGMARILAGVVFAAIGTFLPHIWVKWLIRKRRKELNGQLLEFLLSLAEGVKSSPTVQEALKIVAQEMPDPLSSELKKTVQDLQYAKPFDQAIGDLGERLNVPEYKLVIGAMQIQDRTGGELEKLLRNMAKVFQERQELIAEIKAIVRGPKSTAITLLVAPLVLFLLFSMLSKGFFEPMFSSTIGWVMFGMAVFLYGLGSFFIIQLTKYINKVS